MRDEIGKILQEELQKEGKSSIKDFANLMGVSVKTLYNIFDGKSELKLDQIVTASKILNVDLLKKFAEVYNHKPSRLEESESDFLSLKKPLTITINLKGSFDSANELPDLLRKIKEDALIKGFRLA